MNNKYNNSIIYIIKCKDKTIKDCYIGSTINFKNRKKIHKSVCNNENSKSFNSKVYKFIRDNGGFNNFEIKKMITHNCNNKQELLKLEGEYIKLYKPSLNIKIEGRTRKEYRENNKLQIKGKKKEYYEKNKDKINNKKKEYRELNKEYQKEYYEKNKLEINEKKKIYYQNNKDKIKEKDKQYRENNKDILKEKNKIYYQNNKDILNEKITCECGSIVGKSGIPRHKKTKKHINHLKNL